MDMQNQEESNKKQIIFIIIVIILILIINIILHINNKIKIIQNDANPKPIEVVSDNNTSINTAISNIDNVTNTEIIQYLSNLNERDRMEYYCGTYFKYIYEGEYNNAYKLLYSDFKEKYFPTQEQYEEYIKKSYPSFYGLSYDDISRQGNLYVLRLKIVDLSSSEDTDKEEIQRIVIRENDYNDFEMSFQVKEI